MKWIKWRRFFSKNELYFSLNGFESNNNPLEREKTVKNELSEKNTAEGKVSQFNLRVKDRVIQIVQFFFFDTGRMKVITKHAIIWYHSVPMLLFFFHT